jgi:flagellar basal body rod protein FlgG
MNISIQQAASALQAYEQWHETIANNMSAANVPGFKRSTFSLKGEETGPVDSSEVSAENTSLKNYLMPKGDVHLDHSRGLIKHTGQPTDIAIGEQGYFELVLEDDSTAYTRDGEFRVNEQGELVNKQGYKVMGTGGPIQFNEETGTNFHIAPDGSISENGVNTGEKLLAVEIVDMSKLVHSGDGNFVLSDETAETKEVDAPNFQQRYVEQSNVSAIHEMTRMIHVMRSFEANHHVIQQHDQRLGKVINELGQPI